MTALQKNTQRKQRHNTWLIRHITIARLDQLIDTTWSNIADSFQPIRKQLVAFDQ